MGACVGKESVGNVNNMNNMNDEIKLFNKIAYNDYVDGTVKIKLSNEDGFYCKITSNGYYEHTIQLINNNNIQISGYMCGKLIKYILSDLRGNLRDEYVSEMIYIEILLKSLIIHSKIKGGIERFIEHIYNNINKFSGDIQNINQISDINYYELFNKNPINNMEYQIPHGGRMPAVDINYQERKLQEQEEKRKLQEQEEKRKKSEFQRIHIPPEETHLAKIERKQEEPHLVSIARRPEEPHLAKMKRESEQLLYNVEELKERDELKEKFNKSHQGEYNWSESRTLDEQLLDLHNRQMERRQRRRNEFQVSNRPRRQNEFEVSNRQPRSEPDPVLSMGQLEQGDSEYKISLPQSNQSRPSPNPPIPPRPRPNPPNSKYGSMSSAQGGSPFDDVSYNLQLVIIIVLLICLIYCEIRYSTISGILLNKKNNYYTNDNRCRCMRNSGCIIHST